MKQNYILGIIVLVLLVTFGCKDDNSQEEVYPQDHDTLSGEAAVVARAEELSNTLVTSHLECPVPEGTNVLWCATFNVAWNELCDLVGGPIQLKPKEQNADILNRKQITADVIDPSSFVALAGLGPETITRIKKELQERFSGAARPHSLPSTIPEDVWLAYAYLFQYLPFEYAFTKMEYPFRFSEEPVASFGIQQYLPDSQQNEALMARQVLVYDYRNNNDFIVELIPRNREHRIILACVPPENSLAELITEVYARISGKRPKRLAESGTLKIPVIDFEVLKHYSQFAGRQIVTSNPEINGTIIEIAMQSIRFKLDEKGAVLKSEALFASSASQDLIFDKPFLVLLMKRKAELPYFALWVANSELLSPYQFAIRFDGLYRWRADTGSSHYIRFYKDGTVIGINSSKEPEQIATELNKNQQDIDKDSYHTSEKTVRFSFRVKSSPILYELYGGKIEGDIITMRINLNTKISAQNPESRQYKFIPVDFSP